MAHDMYATKGIEYLIVIGYLLAMAGVLTFFSRRAARTIAPQARGAEARVAPWFALADGYHYHQGHAWAALDGGEIVTVGLDDFAARLIGRPDGLRLPAVGARLRQGEPGWGLEADGRALTMLCPVEGTVVAVNPAVLETPQLAADDPYGEGWLLRVHAPDGQTSRRNLLSGALASVWMQHTVERLRRMPAGELGLLMADGGAPVPGFGRALEPQVWQTVVREFFLTG